MADYLQYAPEVEEALQSGKPVVALESTIITHGMPYPQNLDTARSVEQIIREGGAIPATIALMDGKIRIGLSSADLERLATDTTAIKVSRRDLPVILTRRQTGATTVSATMIAAEMAGIRVFVTGGIGGVHIGGEDSMDVSADLRELSRTSVAVVSAGAKSILDIGRTLEYLETEGVPVIGWGTEAFPAFYTRDSGYKADFRIDTAEEMARVLHTKWQMGLAGGVLIANPVPEADAMAAEEVDRIVRAALKEADSRGVGGKDLTPFLLKAIGEETGGRSLQTNIALVRHNAEKGAALAKALSTLENQS